MACILQVALLQMTACGNDQEANRAKGEAYCRRACAMGAGIALFPEMWNIGYTSFHTPQAGASDVWRTPERWSGQATAPDPGLQQARAQWQAQAIGADSPFVTHFQQLARELDMAIALTYLERWPGAPRNTVTLFDRHGALAMTYAKVHTCDFGLTEDACTPGQDFYVCVLDTARGPVRIGAMICYDREFPESARVLMLKGAEVILTPNACEMEANRVCQFRSRAYENMLGVALTNYAAPKENGHSVAFDGIAFDDHGSRDTLLIEAGAQEGIYLAAFDLERLRAYRAQEIWGNAYRHPQRYGALTAAEVQPPFVRVNAQGQRYEDTRR